MNAAAINPGGGKGGKKRRTTIEAQGFFYRSPVSKPSLLQKKKRGRGGFSIVTGQQRGGGEIPECHQSHPDKKERKGEGRS